MQVEFKHKQHQRIIISGFFQKCPFSVYVKVFSQLQEISSAFCVNLCSIVLQAFTDTVAKN